jgi:5-methyltetrahydrofolate--homocysteine methyltransferase
VPATDGFGFEETLAKRPLLLDAAMGTRLIAKGLDLAFDDPSLWVIDHPEEVSRVHRHDIQAGADALLTDTFGANRAWLDRFGRGDQALVINRRATELARSAPGPDRFLIGSIGPTASDHPTALLEQAEILAESGVDALLLETHRLDQAEASLRLLREVRVPILVSLFAWPDPVDDSARRLIDLGALAIGANCQVGMKPALELARRLRLACDHPLLIKPSAGLPGSPPETPESFGDAVAELLDLGVGLIGGCCGATEAHISALREQINRNLSHGWNTE